MAVYIAVCDDNIADRKQTERLLEREKDARLKSDGEVLYPESFGSSEALLKTPVKYDIFLIDLTQGSDNGMELAKKLRHHGIIAPIVLLSSSIDYTSFSNSPSDLIFIEKPISKGQISHLVDVAKDWSKNKPALLEIRGKKDTYFLPDRELIRAAEKPTCVEAATTDGDYIEIPGDIKSFSNVTGGFNCFINCKKSIINIQHIVSMDKNVFTLDNGECFEYSLMQAPEILKSFVKYTSSLRENGKRGHGNADA